MTPVTVESWHTDGPLVLDIIVIIAQGTAR
jgi:hypothetical protein